MAGFPGQFAETDALRTHQVKTNSSIDNVHALEQAMHTEMNGLIAGGAWRGVAGPRALQVYHEFQAALLKVQEYKRMHGAATGQTAADNDSTEMASASAIGAVMG